MIDIKYITANLELVKEKTAKRGAEFDFDTLLRLDDERKKLIFEAEELKKKRNDFSKSFPLIKQQGGDVDAAQKEMKQVSERIAEMDRELTDIQERQRMMLLTLPNLVDDSLPLGRSEEDNVLYREWGAKPSLDFEAKPHWDIAENLKLVDFERGTKVAAARFSAYTGMGAKLERALINFMLDTQSSRGYTEVMTPFLVNAASMTGTGQLPKFEEDAFKCERDGLYLIPTAEVPVTNLYAGEILDESALPIKHCAYSPCFRREAGSHGKDVRGLIRQHQFNKVELVKLVKPEDGWAELELLLRDAENILQLLGIHYRVMTLSTGDIGFASAKTYDIEVWLPGQNCYREISSCSCFTDFQARRANIRFRKAGDKRLDFVYTLNGSGLAVGRTFLSVLENYQLPDGRVKVPEVLRPYLGGVEIIG
ncbi:serine--tRNA ligase [Geovibrio thiophilus]|uniref:Serine--tRNA ligase n=1 Tax=Geovibrio thiophilus TaxID=139438 RepID=A0A410JVA6_9BACT|nr:serine--tRNA ligase [Geovibrio thiophilus]QAR31981.1 serine--tRNA ligase [Geovibrio thiophilus]